MNENRRKRGAGARAIRSLRGAAVLAIVVVGIQGIGQLAPPNTNVWEPAQPARPGAGGLEAERETWVRTPRRFEQVADRAGQEWSLNVAGDTRPVMRRLRLQSMDGTVDSPFLLSDKNYDFRSVPALVASVTKGAGTEEQKALALRELLIGEGFYFHFVPPPTPDPIHRLTNVGYGFCGHHSQIFDELAQAAGLNSSICGHSFGSGHATNEVFYARQWHFIDSDAETVIRRADGVIPSYEDIRKDPNLIPAGDAYGQTSFGIDGARFVSALYSGPTQCYERRVSRDTTYGALGYPLRQGESISWEWRDADFTKNRQNKLPIYGTGTIEYQPKLADFRQPDGGVRELSGDLTMASDTDTGRLQMPVSIAYPPLEVLLSARLKGSEDQVEVRISKDQGKTWLSLRPEVGGGLSRWRVSINDPDRWQDQVDNEKTTDTSRTLAAGHYGYLLEIAFKRIHGSAPSLSGAQLATVFRHYPPALPFLKAGDNKLTYLDAGGRQGRVHITLEYEERSRAPGLSMRSSDWGWGETTTLSTPGEAAELPALATGPTGIIHAVYAVGTAGARRIAYRRYQDGQWAAQRVLTAAREDANHPVVAEDGEGTVWVAYQSGVLWKGGDVFVVSMRGDAVSAPMCMNTSDPYHIAFFPSITAHDRFVAVAWEGGQSDRDRNTAWGIEVGWLRIYNGGSWSSPALVKGKPFINLGLPKVLYDSHGRLNLTATKGPRYFLTVSSGTDAFQWLTPEWLYHSRGGALYSDRSRNLWAVFDGQNSGTTNEIYMRMLPAGAVNTDIEHWTKALRVSEDDKKPSIYPDLVAEDRDRLAVVWMDYRQKSAEVYSKVFSQGRWSPDLLVSHGADKKARQAAEIMTPNQILWSRPEGLQSEYPHFARAADGTVWAVWQDRIDGGPGTVTARPLRIPSRASQNGVSKHYAP